MKMTMTNPNFTATGFGALISPLGDVDGFTVLARRRLH